MLDLITIVNYKAVRYYQNNIIQLKLSLKVENTRLKPNIISNRRIGDRMVMEDLKNNIPFLYSL